MNEITSRSSWRYAASPAMRWAKWGGSNVPPRMPRRTQDRIERRHHRHPGEPDTGGGNREPAARGERIEVTVSDAKREGDRLSVGIDPGEADDLPAAHPRPFGGGDGGQVGVRGAHPSPVMDRHTEHPGDLAGKGDGSGRGGPHRGPHRCRQIGAPVPAIGPRRCESDKDGAVHRSCEQARRREGKREEQNGHRNWSRREARYRSERPVNRAPVRRWLRWGPRAGRALPRADRRGGTVW